MTVMTRAFIVLAIFGTMIATALLLMATSHLSHRGDRLVTQHCGEYACICRANGKVWVPVDGDQICKLEDAQ